MTEMAADPALVGSPVLQKFTQDGFLKLDSNQDPHAPLAFYETCVSEQKLNYNWMAFLDLDEFLVVRGCVPILTTFPLRRLCQDTR